MESLAIGKVIKMPAMRRGICEYPKERILVSQETLEELAPSIQGVPVVIDHPEEFITDENIDKITVVGRVADMHYNADDDSWYAHFVIDKQEGIDLLKKGWGVSTAWFGDEYDKGGTYNNVPYDRSLKKGRYEHLAIVERPRYEMAKNPIFLNSFTLQNDKNKGIINKNIINAYNSSLKDQNMIGKLFKKLITREELKTNEGEELYVNIDGVEMPLNIVVKEMAELMRNKKNEDEEEEKKEKENKKMANETDEIEVDGKKMTISELKKAYLENKGSGKKKMNEDDEKNEDSKITEESDNKKKENSLSDEEKQKQKDRFEKIKTVHENGIRYDLQENFISTAERVEMGRKKYGYK